MASANCAQARQLQARIPHTYTAMEHLIMSMADAYNNRGKTSIFGYDKGLKSYRKFEDKLKNTLLAMPLDRIGSRSSPASEYLENLLMVLDAWAEIFPNWPDAHAFAFEKLRANKSQACALISILIGVEVGVHTSSSTTNHENFKLSESALDIIKSQQRIYDEGIWSRDRFINKNNIRQTKSDALIISGAGWRHDKVQGILWNESTKEILNKSSGLGYSQTDDYFIIYNKVEPRKILQSEVTEGLYK